LKKAKKRRKILKNYYYDSKIIPRIKGLLIVLCGGGITKNILYIVFVDKNKWFYNRYCGYFFA